MKGGGQMTAIETIRMLMQQEGYTLSELAEYSDLGSKSNICQMLSREDLKVGTFVKMLEVMGYQLVAQGANDNEVVIDNEEG
jgi:antitoxin component HigA of HigAB toxin-antitoxin module